MTGTVMIKSYNRGFSIHLDPDADIEQIKSDLADKLRESASFFKDATVAVSFEDRQIDSQTEHDLVNIITECSSIKVACVAGKNKLTQEMLLNAMNEIEYKAQANIDSEVQVIKQNIKDGMVVDVPGSLLILGDVYPGTSVNAAGDIFIYGALLGQACAGSGGDVSRVVAALDMKPERLRIAGLRYKPSEKPKWTIKSKSVPTPKLAHLVDTDIVFSPIDGDFWKTFKPIEP